MAGSAVLIVLAFAPDANHVLTRQEVAGCGLKAMESHRIAKEYPLDTSVSVST